MLIVNKNNFSVNTIRKSQNSPSAPQNTFYTDFKICLAIAGEAVWEIEGHSYLIQPGDIVFLKMGQKRHFTSFGKEGFQLCTFTLTRNAFSGPHHFFFFLDCVKRQENVFKNSPLSPILMEIYQDWNENSPDRYELASAKLTEFFVKAQRVAANSYIPAAKSHYELLELMDYIDSNIANGVSLQSVAQKAGMTESSFSRRFSAINGISFKEYVVEKKVQRAIWLLQTSKEKMIDIALDSGFDSVSGFYAAFRKKTGTTPGRFLEFDV